MVHLIDSYSSHPTAIPNGFHAPTSNTVILRYSKAAIQALSKTGSIDGVSKSIWYNPNDWYGVPQIRSLRELKKWMRMTWLNIQELDDNALFIFCETSIKYAQRYLAEKWYYLPTILKKDIYGAVKDIVWLIWTMNKYKKEGDIRASTIFLKVIRAQFKVLTSKDATWRSILNAATGQLEGKDKQLKIDIMKFFNEPDGFFYEKWAARFWQESTIAHGRSTKEGTSVAFNAVVDFKTLESQVLKTISQNSYDANEAMNDKNRMRIEVKTKNEMLQMALIMIQSWLMKGWIKWEQKWEIFTSETGEWKGFQNSYVNGIKDEHIKNILSWLPHEKIKNNTSERQELKITSTNPSFEIQIVLVWNTNESGWNASPYYKMKADIDEEIALRWGYITKDRVLKHIERRIPDLIQFWQNPTQKTPEKIFEHFITQEKKLLPLFVSDYIPKKGQSPSYKHTGFFTNKDFTSRWIQVYSHALSFKIWHESTGKFDPLNTPSSPSNP